VEKMRCWGCLIVCAARLMSSRTTAMIRDKCHMFGCAGPDPKPCKHHFPNRELRTLMQHTVILCTFWDSI
jgi:hypothetical protein